MLLEERRGTAGARRKIDVYVVVERGAELAGEGLGGEGAGCDLLEDGESDGPAERQVVLDLGAEERWPPVYVERARGQLSQICRIRSREDSPARGSALKCHDCSSDCV
jgi:hypothetical protein